MRNTTAMATLDRHLAEARAMMLRAVHFARFFGKPIADFSDAHNEQRRVANDRTVRAFASQAGQFARFAEMDVSELHQLAMHAAEVKREMFTDDRIVEGIVAGWCDTDELLSAWDRRHTGALDQHSENTRASYVVLLKQDAGVREDA